MRARLILTVLVGGGLAIAGYLVAGGYDVSASKGHLPGVSQLLHLTMENAVAWRAPEEVPVDLDDPALIRRGAGQYHYVCRDCHGAPGREVGAVALHMVPAPPHISDAVSHWQPQELFWIVKHGIKMTGMPAWPAPHRDDEVWAMVAFLQQIPRLEPAEYQRVVSGPLQPGEAYPLSSELEALLYRCATCHGYDGAGLGVGAFPRLDLLSEEYIAASLLAYQEHARSSGIMAAQTTGLKPQAVAALARHYARAGGRQEKGASGAGQGAAAAGGASAPAPETSAAGGAAAAGPVLADRGRALARDGLRQRKIPACSACHGPVEHRRAPLYPPLAGQPEAYLAQQLELFREGHRGGTAFAVIMQQAARHLSDDDIAALAAYYAQLRPGQFD